MEIYSFGTKGRNFYKPLAVQCWRSIVGMYLRISLKKELWRFFIKFIQSYFPFMQLYIIELRKSLCWYTFQWGHFYFG